MELELVEDRIWPQLLGDKHVVSYRDLKRHHGLAGVAVWARAVAEAATLPGDYVRWEFYNRMWITAQKA